MSISPAKSSLVFGSPGLTNVENQVKGLIEAAEGNIERLSAQIRELTSMRERERSVLATLRLMLVPIGKLPTELLVEIFKHTVQTPVFYNGQMVQYGWGESAFNPEGRTVLPKVLCLAQVSPYWRQIVRSSPQLWTESAIYLNLDKEGTSGDIHLTGLQDLLALSSPLPISVSLSQNKSRSSQASSSSRARARLMLSTAHRWRNLSLEMVSFTHFDGLAPGTFDALERLHIYTDWHQTTSVIAFQSSPRLRILTLEIQCTRPSDLQLFRMPWSQLTQLRVGDMSLGGCRTILLQCSNLVSAHFRTSHHWDLSVDAANTPLVILPFLKTLIVDFCGGVNGDNNGIDAFFMPLALPSLQTLRLEFDPDVTDVWPTEPFSQFQNRSPNIEQIGLLFSDIRTDRLITLLRHSPALTALSIENSWSCVSNELFEALKYDSRDSLPLAPKLWNIKFSAVGESFDESVLEDAIRSRWWTDEQDLPGASSPRIARLRQVSIVCFEEDDNVLGDLKDRLSELEEQGLDLDLH